MAAILSRIIYFVLCSDGYSTDIAGFLGISPRPVLDTYGYFEYAMIRTGETGNTLAAGLSTGYGDNLSGFLRFVGNKMQAVCVYQLVLQILWLILFFIGMSFLFGQVAGMTAGSILLLSPWIMNTVFVICPENYYMFQWTVVLTVLGCLQIHIKSRGLNNWSRLCFIVMGFYLGVICIRNSLGIYLPLWLFCAAAGGIFCQWVIVSSRKNKQKTSAKEDNKMAVEEKQAEYFITEDGRKIKYIENPLPGPKKHVKREMDFDLQEFDDDLMNFPDDDEFDFKIRENDDFDF